MDIQQIVSVLALTVSVAALVRLLFGDSKTSGAEIASIDTKLDFVANDLKDIKAEQRSARSEIKEVRDIAEHAKERADAAHNRLDRAGIDIVKE